MSQNRKRLSQTPPVQRCFTEGETRECVCVSEKQIKVFIDQSERFSVLVLGTRGM